MKCGQHGHFKHLAENMLSQYLIQSYSKTTCEKENSLFISGSVEATTTSTSKISNTFFLDRQIGTTYICLLDGNTFFMMLLRGGIIDEGRAQY